MTAYLFAGFIATFVAIMQFGVSSAVILTMEPQVLKTLNSTVSMSCSVGIYHPAAIQVFQIKIVNKRDKAIAVLHSDSEITFGKEFAERLDATGKIDDNVTGSHLDITIKRPIPKDMGGYTCHVYLMDFKGNFVKRKSENYLTIENPQLQTLNSSVNQLSGKVKTQEKEIEDLEEKVTPMVAFSVTNNLRMIYPKIGTTLVLPDVLFTVGGGYDKTTGIFTAPVSGLYAFHLALEIACRPCYIDAQIKAGDTPLVRLKAGDRSDVDQGSVSTVTKLNVGDTVKVHVKYITSGSFLTSKKFTVFTGYLLNDF